MKLKNMFKKEAKKTIKEANVDPMNKSQMGKLLGGSGTPPPPAPDPISLNSSRSN